MVEAFNNIYKNKKVVITGETGFKGSWLASWLLELGAEVYGFSKGLPSGPCLFNLLELRDQISHQKGDINTLDEVERLINDVRPDFLFHLAAQAIVKDSYENPINTFNTNVMGTINVMEALRKSQTSCVGIFVTSDKCYHNDEMDRPFKEEDPLGGKDPYSASKGAAEVVIRSYYYSFFQEGPVKIGTGRAGNVIGGGDWAANRIVPDCIRAWAENEKVVLRRPDAIRPWQHVLEPLSGYLTLGQRIFESSIVNGQSFNFGPDPELRHSVGNLVEKMSIEWDPNDSNNELLKIEPEGKFDESQYLRLDSSKANKLLDWNPVLSFDETVSMTVNWYKRFYQNQESAKDLCQADIKRYTAKLIES
ncbi:MAG: CDP-glucose 4,6-dehydratase [bacterium]|nr:CDP-glucose 4,6-dehydratase [bacterium]